MPSLVLTSVTSWGLNSVASPKEMTGYKLVLSAATLCHCLFYTNKKISSQADDVQPGDIQAGDIQAGDIQTGDIQASEIQAGDI